MTWLAVAMLFALFVALVLVRACAPPPQAHGVKMAAQWLTAGLFVVATVAALVRGLRDFPQEAVATVFGVVGAVLVGAVLLQAIWNY